MPNVRLRGYEKDIRELLDILLDNAFKYSADNGFVLFSVKKEKNIIITVENSVQPNIDTNITMHMFDRFYRGDESHNANIEGSGIGLAVAKAIANRYMGDIKAEIRENKMVITTSLKGQKEFGKKQKQKKEKTHEQ